MPEAERAHRRLAHDRKRLRQDRIQRLAPPDTPPQLICLRPKFVVGERLDRTLQGIGAIDVLAVLAQQALIATAKELCQNRSQTVESLTREIARP